MITPRQLPTLTVVIPTYQRPDWIRRAVLSLARQTPPPDEVIAVVRDGDLPTHDAVVRLQSHSLPFTLRQGVVAQPGFMPPVFEGFCLASSDIVAVMDDDAEAVDGWVGGLLNHYLDLRVGGVGGRCINMLGDREAEVPETGRVGYVSALGRFVGNMYKRPTFTQPVHVDFFMGGCMSYRREVARAFEFDTGLNQNVAFGYEVDLGLQARKWGWILIFDPAVAVRHYSAPRAVSGMREFDDVESTYWYAHNVVRVVARRLGGLRRLVAIVWSLMIGERRAPGLVPWLLGPLTRPLGYQVAVSSAALQGRLRAFRDSRRL